ncbi:MAG TPA: hypothetical protein PKJ13_03205 [bacterium]|nr:hypothetical protein [bacterium]
MLILGCTHYPFYLDRFRAELDRLRGYRENGEYIYQPFMADTIHLVDPAINTARELYDHLRRQGLFAERDLAGSEFFISVPSRSRPRPSSMPPAISPGLTSTAAAPGWGRSTSNTSPSAGRFCRRRAFSGSNAPSRAPAG